MGVRINQSGHNHAATGIKLLDIFVHSTHLSTGTKGNDGAIFNQNSTILDDAQIPQVTPSLRVRHSPAGIEELTAVGE